MTDKERELIFPEAHSTVDGILQYLDNNPKETLTSYGHAVGMLAAVAYANCETCDFETQKERLRKVALKYIDRYGPRIIEFLKPELRETLNIGSKEDVE